MRYVGIDTGKYRTKFAYYEGVTIKIDSFPSLLQPYQPTNIESELSTNDLIIEFNKKKYFGGELAEREQVIPINFKDESKAHETTLINVLTALHRINGHTFKLIVGSPISKRTEEEKKKIKDMLKGEYTIIINGVKKRIAIIECEVSPEGAAAYYSLNKKHDNIQGLDFGSTTINYFYMQNGRFVNRRSGTFPYDTSFTNYEQLMEGIYSQLNNRFQRHLPTVLLGGLAKEFHQFAKKYYPESFIADNYQYATSIGFLMIARSLYA